LDDIFAIQSEIAEKVAKELKVKLLEEEKAKLEIKPTENTEAFMLYLKGRHYWNERSDVGLRKAIAYFEGAIEKDGKFALGYSGLADCYVVIARNSQAEFEPTYQKAKEFATKALEIDDSLAEGHATLANIFLYYDHAWAESEAEFRKSLEQKPNYSTAHQWYSHLLTQQRRFPEAEREILTALQLDPFSPVINMNAGAMYYYYEDYDKAIELYHKAREMDPTFLGVYRTSGLIEALVRKGLLEDAMREVDAFGRAYGRPLEQNLLRAYVLGAMGKPTESRELLGEVELNYRKENIHPYFIALVRFLLKDDDAGFRWLQTAAEVHDGALNLIAVDFELERVRSDPRYIEILTRMGLAHAK